MMKLDLAHINYWAVLVAALATFMLGGLWYTALFGKAWARLSGYSDAKLAEISRSRGSRTPAR